MLALRILFFIVSAWMLAVAGFVFGVQPENYFAIAYHGVCGLFFGVMCLVDASQKGYQRGLEDGRSCKAYEDTRYEESFTDAEVDAALEVVKERRR